MARTDCNTELTYIDTTMSPLLSAGIMSTNLIRTAVAIKPNNKKRNRKTIFVDGEAEVSICRISSVMKCKDSSFLHLQTSVNRWILSE